MARKADRANGSPAVLAVRDMAVSFGTRHGLVQAVRGVSFELGTGETLGIVGESGSGKSILARAIMDLLPPTAQIAEEAQVELRGESLGQMRPSALQRVWGRQIAMVFQDPMTTLNPVRRIGDQLTEPMRHHLKASRANARERALGLLNDVGIPEPAKRLAQYPHELSGGMCQRVSIALALSCEPSVLIADEPTTALDVTVQAQILDLLHNLQQRHHLAVVLITHDMGVVAHHTDRVAVMYAGQFVEVSTTSELFAEVRHPYTSALLRSIPRIDDVGENALMPIAGRPPDPTQIGDGCPFAPRCASARERCLAELPTLHSSSLGRDVRCFFPIGTPEGDKALHDNRAAGRTAAGLVASTR